MKDLPIACEVSYLTLRVSKLPGWPEGRLATTSSNQNALIGIDPLSSDYLGLPSH
jgi:hypothetical protein